MNLVNVELMISTRIKADTGANGLYGSSGRLINNFGFDLVPPGTAAPYIIVRLISGDEDDTFPTDAVDYDIEFEVVANKTTNTQSVASGILNRLRALFHRYQPTVTSSNNTEMFRVTGTTAHTEDERHYIERYRLRLEDAS